MFVGCEKSNPVSTTITQKDTVFVKDSTLCFCDRFFHIKIFEGKINQGGVTAPMTAQVFKNTFSAEPIWTRIGIGQYLFQLTNEFPVNSTFIQITNGWYTGKPGTVSYDHTPPSTIAIYTFNSEGELADNILFEAMLSITVYK